MGEMEMNKIYKLLATLRRRATHLPATTHSIIQNFKYFKDLWHPDQVHQELLKTTS
jgi:hypothetical protein